MEFNNYSISGDESMLLTSLWQGTPHVPMAQMLWPLTTMIFDINHTFYHIYTVSSSKSKGYVPHYNDIKYILFFGLMKRLYKKLKEAFLNILSLHALKKRVLTSISHSLFDILQSFKACVV